MSTSLRKVVSEALVEFVRGRDSLRRAFGVADAAEIVEAVLRSGKPREGETPDGWAYFVHGIGYTVILPGGGEIHIDAGRTGDTVSVHDVLGYLESVGESPTPEVAEIRSVLDALVAEGHVGAEDGRYRL
jgi:hypothetical protein